MFLSFIVLLFLFQLSHFIADYPLQGSYMLRKFMGGTAWILPLAAHCGVHMVFTFFICFFFSESLKVATSLAAFEFISHFIMDRVKASPHMLGQYKAFSGREYSAFPLIIRGGKSPTLVEATENEMQEIFKSNKYFWWSLGIDQSWHHMTHYVIIACLIVDKYGIPHN